MNQKLLFYFTLIEVAYLNCVAPVYDIAVIQNTLVTAFHNKDAVYIVDPPTTGSALFFRKSSNRHNVTGIERTDRNTQRKRQKGVQHRCATRIARRLFEHVAIGST